jgi:hypothetical protein
VLLPSDPENYYATRHLVPPDMLAEMGKAGWSSPITTPSAAAPA